ncbi:MAG TPA: heparan-alpha-glucosaminide N-acetyltransferase domain-containing protein [Terriglobales bacterium]|nr:heparan-alpha-glucosaminide N-acetyltransferase domain-containing protein [Terriglobales bacterium]
MAAIAEVVTAKRVRLESIDIVRGFIMILMALDHVRDFFGVPGANPTDLSSTTVALFFTRWITHFCAPTFFLLTGTGAYLSLRKKSKRELSTFLFTRGLWLIFLEIVVTRDLGWQFNFDYHITMLMVLWALGWSMIVLSALVWLPTSLVAAFGLVMVVSHNLLDSIQSSNPLWTILHSPNFILTRPEHSIRVPYSLIPWVGVTAAGYSFGQIYSSISGAKSAWAPDRRRAFLLRLGMGLTAAFIVLRGINFYGDPVRWSTQKSAIFTVLSFLNTNKYPPSLLFLLMTLGPAMLFLWAVDGRTPRWLRPALVFGKVPMFYYLLHIPLIHLLAIAVCYARYGQVHWMFESPSPDKFPVTPPPGWGFSLPIVYLVWAVVVVALYPLCRWFAGVRQRRSDAWLSYF